jgi:hypothetical protein
MVSHCFTSYSFHLIESFAPKQASVTAAPNAAAAYRIFIAIAPASLFS